MNSRIPIVGCASRFNSNSWLRPNLLYSGQQLCFSMLARIAFGDVLMVMLQIPDSVRWVGGRLQIYFKRSSPLLSAEAAFRRLGCSHLGTLRQCDFRFIPTAPARLHASLQGLHCCACSPSAAAVRRLARVQRTIGSRTSTLLPNGAFFLPAYALTSRAFKDKAVKPSSLRAATFRRLAFY